MDKTTVSVRLSPDEYATLKRFAEMHLWSLSTAVRYLVRGIEFKESADAAQAAEKGEVR